MSPEKRNDPVLGQYELALLGTWWYRVSIGLFCLYVYNIHIHNNIYIEKSVDLVGCAWE